MNEILPRGKKVINRDDRRGENELTVPQQYSADAYWQVHRGEVDLGDSRGISVSRLLDRSFDLHKFFRILPFLPQTREVLLRSVSNEVGVGDFETVLSGIIELRDRTSDVTKIVLEVADGPEVDLLAFRQQHDTVEQVKRRTRRLMYGA